MAKVYQRATARRDLVEHFEYLAENSGLRKWRVRGFDNYMIFHMPRP